MKFLILPLLALVTSTRAADLAGDFKGPLGIQLYTFRESFKTNVPATLDKLKALGFAEIEGGGDYGLGIEKFNALLHERGLKMVSAGFGYESLKKDIGVKHYFVEDESAAPLESVPQSVKYLQSVRY